MHPSHVLDNVIRQVIAGDFDGFVAHDAAQRDNCDFGCSAADIDNHATFRCFYVDSDTDITTSFFDLANYVDFNRNWYYKGKSDEGWFYTETVSVQVLAPDKVIGERDIEVKVGGAAPAAETATVMNIQIADYYNAGKGNESWGIFFVDPYDSSTWILPSDIYAHFDGKTAGDYDSYPYTVAWRNVAGDDTVRFDLVNGVYYLRDVAYESSYFFLEAEIGDGGGVRTCRA